MGRKAREKRERRGANTSTLDQHKREGNQFVPPLAQVPSLSPASWLNDRLPELLWGALLLNRFARETALEVLRTLGDRVAKSVSTYDVRLSGIAAALPVSKTVIIDFLCRSEEARLAFRPLLLLPGLPGREAWLSAIQDEPRPDDWKYLAAGVADVLDHQSQPATDLRWVVVLCRVAARMLHVPPERVKELALYPHLGDQRTVSRSIRATEISLATTSSETDAASWPTEFWTYCLKATPCFPLIEDVVQSDQTLGTTVGQLELVVRNLLDHCKALRTTTALDSRHDTVFGMALFALALVAELMRVGASTTIGARFTLRALLELYVTLAFLVKKDNVQLWKSYRVFGAAQAKLALLKLEETDDHPLSVSIDTLRNLANEDVWQEFLSIDVGHWTKSNLRELSVQAEVKEDYDRFYSWTSMYSHGHWGAVRASVFDTCGNSLHRLHRIPRSIVRSQADVLPDAVILVDKLLNVVDQAYPQFASRLKAG
jgi:Family of unknown function (DUF5677)